MSRLLAKKKRTGFLQEMESVMTPELSEFALKYLNGGNDTDTTLIFIRLYSVLDKIYKDQGKHVTKGQIMDQVEFIIKNGDYRNMLFSNIDRLNELPYILKDMNLITFSASKNIIPKIE